MKASPYRARVHLFVCTNRRNPNDPLGGGCGDRGEAVFRALKGHTPGGVWVAQTSCLGLCPKSGCTVAIAPAMQYLVEVGVEDVPNILAAL